MRVAELVLSTLRACRAERMDPEIAKRFCSGGMAVVTALSEWLQVEIHRDGHVWRQRYVRGHAETEFEKFEETSRSGTSLRFKLDASIVNASFDLDDLRNRAQMIALDVPGTQINVDAAET